MATFSEMLDFVRSQADADDTDAPDAMLQVHARVAYNDILSRRSDWDHLAVTYTVATVQGQSDYAFTSFSANDMDHIASIGYTSGGVFHRLTYMTRTDAEVQFGMTTAQARPVAWTIVNNKLRVYPNPSEVLTLSIDGWRTPAAWPAGAGSEPDLPDALHDAIMWYMLSGFYMSQEDTQMAGAYLNEYQQIVDKFVRGEVRNQSPRPLIMGGAWRGQRSFLDHVRGQLE